VSRAVSLTLLLVMSGAPACAQERTSGPTASSRTPTTTRATESAAEIPRRPTSAAEAARQIQRALRIVKDTEATADEIAWAGHAEQLAVREIVAHPRWLPRVLDDLDASMRTQTRDNVTARLAFRSMHPSAPSELADELPAWRILAPPPALILKGFYREAERRYGVDWEYLAAIHLVETAFGRIRGTSVAGAQGPMQFMPTTWDIYGNGGDINDPHDAILAAARLLRANGFSRDKAAALYRYNNSSAYVRGVSLHAGVMQRRPRALLGFHSWQVYYLTQRGGVWLEEGYATRHPIPVDRYLERHPEALR
jgi:soluble lytic murein transglycosylase-like protein